MKTKLLARDLEINLQSAILNWFGFHLQKKPSFLWVLRETRSKNTNVNDDMFKLNQMEKRFIYFYSFLNWKNNLRKYLVRYEQ